MADKLKSADYYKTASSQRADAIQLDLEQRVEAWLNDTFRIEVEKAIVTPHFYARAYPPASELRCFVDVALAKLKKLGFDAEYIVNNVYSAYIMVKWQ